MSSDDTGIESKELRQEQVTHVDGLQKQESRHSGLHKGDDIGVTHADRVGKMDFMSEAVEGENREHSMGLWESFKNYPWGCMWAFIMCFTIVSV